MNKNFCVVFLVVAVLATIGSGAYERRYGRPWNDQRLSRPIIVDEVQNKTSDSSSSSSSSEESSQEMAGGKATTEKPDCKNETEVPSRRSGDWASRRSSRLQRKSLQSQYTSDGATIPRRRSLDGIRTRDRDSGRTQTESTEDTTSNYKLHLLSGRYVQYGDENRWTIWPRLRETGEGATHGAREGETDNDNYRNSETTTAAPNTRKRWPKTTTTSRWVQHSAPARPELRSGGRGGRPELRSGQPAPRLELKSGDNVQFGDGISWQIVVSADGLTRIGTIDDKVMVRIFRPYTEEQRRRYLAGGHHDHTTTSPEKCQMGQDCYNKMLNYQNYGFHLNH